MILITKQAPQQPVLSGGAVRFLLEKLHSLWLSHPSLSFGKSFNLLCTRNVFPELSPGLAGAERERNQTKPSNSASLDEVETGQAAAPGKWEKQQVDPHADVGRLDRMTMRKGWELGH